MISGIIFDFNGTLFWDSLLHEKAWKSFTTNNSLRHLSQQAMQLNIFGKGNAEILKYVFQKELSPVDVIKYTDEKETLYRELVLSDEKNLNLAPGALDLLDYLKSKQIPMTIATSSEETNVDFFFEHLGLSKWFDRRKVVFDNGDIMVKPAPDLFLMAAKNIEVSISECMILEDSKAGIEAAKSAGAGCIVYVENDAPVEFNEISSLIDIRIKGLNSLIELF
jgi:beta-phosphoglucomutase